MVTALQTLAGATVLRKAWSANQAQVLEVVHEVPVDSKAVLPIGEPVTFEDEELGFQFEGKITDVSPNFGDGEGVRYICADAYRTLAKTPAFITGLNGKQSAKLKFVEGTLLHTALNAILDELPLVTLFPGGVDLTGLPNLPIPLTDKGGQFIDTWIDDLLENTEGGIAYVDPNDGSPKLVFRDFYTEPDLNLDIRDFILPDKAPVVATPLMEQANAGQSLDRKYESTIAEGCGEFTRRKEVFIPSTAGPLDVPNNTLEYRFFFPEKRVTGRFLDVDGKCRDDIFFRATFGFPSGFGATVEFHNQKVETDANGNHFGRFQIRTLGIFGAPNPPFPVVEAFWTYTSYDGPLTAKKTSIDPALDNEGEFWEDHPEFFKFTGDTNVDLTASLQFIADKLFKRFSEGSDLSGSIRLHIKGLNKDVRIGAKISNEEFLDARVQHITYDYVARSVITDVSTVPIRSHVERRKVARKDATVEGGGWFQNREQENANCFCGGAIFQDENGVPNNFGGGDGGTSFDCMFGICQERNDDFGQFATLGDCERDCVVGGFDFVSCVGCMQVDHVGQFSAEGDCTAVHPDAIAGCEFTCDDINGCQPVPLGQGSYATRAACENACSGGSGTGSGDDGTNNSFGSSFPSSITSGPAGKVTDCEGCGFGDASEFKFVKQITVDAEGRVTDIQCDNCDLPCGASVDTQGFIFSGGRSAGVSGELDIITLITTIDTDNCGRITAIDKQDYTIRPRWQ